MIDYIINIDWLSVSCYGTLTAPPFNWEVKQTDQRNRIFSTISELYYFGEHVATVQSEPNSPLLKKDLMIVKIENHILYKEKVSEFTAYMLTSWQWQFNNINRVDVALDFQHLNNNLSPQSLISGLFIGEYIRKGARMQVFHGADKNNIDRLYTTKAGNLVAYFNKEVNFNSTSVTGYRCGSRASAVCVYLYNKTLELKQQTDKPYIRKKWERAGFDKNKDTWRLEFSLKGKQFAQMQITDFADDKLFNLADSLIREYFEIRQNLSDGTHPKISLFDGGHTEQILIPKPKKAKGDKSAKLFISRMCNELSRQASSDEPNSPALFDVLRFTLYEYSVQYQLTEYAMKKCYILNLTSVADMFKNTKS